MGALSAGEFVVSSLRVKRGSEFHGWAGRPPVDRDEQGVSARS